MNGTLPPVRPIERTAPSPAIGQAAGDEATLSAQFVQTLRSLAAAPRDGSSPRPTDEDEASYKERRVDGSQREMHHLRLELENIERELARLTAGERRGSPDGRDPGDGPNAPDAPGQDGRKPRTLEQEINAALASLASLDPHHRAERDRAERHRGRIDDLRQLIDRLKFELRSRTRSV